MQTIAAMERVETSRMEIVRMEIPRAMEAIVTDTRTMRSNLPRNPTVRKNTCSHEEVLPRGWLQGIEVVPSPARQNQIKTRHMEHATVEADLSVSSMRTRDG